MIYRDDRSGDELVTDSEHPTTTNAASGFWHSAETPANDLPLRMLRVLVRPHSPGLESDIQHEPTPDPAAGEWWLRTGQLRRPVARAVGCGWQRTL